jgi:ribosomal protein S18 acetylase RimI-like enzyme
VEGLSRARRHRYTRRYYSACRGVEGSLLIATFGSRIIGAIIAAWDGWRGHLHHLAVRPEARRRGVARALVDEAESVLIAKGAQRISVFAEHENSEAIGFYEALASSGYVLDTRMLRYVKTMRGTADGPLRVPETVLSDR